MFERSGIAGFDNLPEVGRQGFAPEINAVLVRGEERLNFGAVSGNNFEGGGKIFVEVIFEHRADKS